MKIMRWVRIFARRRYYCFVLKFSREGGMKWKDSRDAVGDFQGYLDEVALLYNMDWYV